jgi:sulfite exporter TauE/SafE
MIAQCLHGLTALAPGGGVPALMLALFVMGLAGGATHCSGMCAPFVLAQSAAVAGSPAGGRVLHRLSGAALLPYHLGRMLGYAGLGAVAGGTAGLLALAAGALRPALATLLALAALFMLIQGSAQLRGWLPLHVPTLRPPDVVQRWLGILLAAPLGWRGVMLGLLLSALPCGLLYGALAASAAAGSALGGALAMAAFVAGTMPALIGVGLLGRLFGRRFLPSLRPAAAALFLLNAAVLAGMALRVAGI